MGVKEQLIVQTLRKKQQNPLIQLPNGAFAGVENQLMAAMARNSEGESWKEGVAKAKIKLWNVN